MKKDLLFAIDTHTEEVLVSYSTKGSNKIEFIERIKLKQNASLYHAVLALTLLTNDADFDANIFKAMDKLCQMLYAKHKKSK